MGTIIVLILLLCVIGFIVKGMIKDKKNGKSPVCGCNCKECGGHCQGAGQKR